MKGLVAVAIFVEGRKVIRVKKKSIVKSIDMYVIKI